MQSKIREAFRARLKNPKGGTSHRLTLIAWAYLRGKSYSFVEPRVRQGNVPSPTSIAGALFAVMAEAGVQYAPEDPKGDLEALKIGTWMNETKGVVIPRERPQAEPKPIVPKLYVIVRGDIPPGAVCSQAMHAALEYAFTFPDQAKVWHDLSNTVCILQAEGEAHIEEIACEMDRCKKPHVRFREPDMGGAMTAVAVGQDAAKLLRHLPLALS